ncbi:hypothetical protein P5V15_015540 [Pogonomyrmex californicus]
MERPKRCVPKPSRYITTSSDESPKKKRCTNTSIDKDIDAIKRILQEDANQNYDSSFANTYTCIQPQMNVETYIPADSYATQVIHDGKTFTQLRCNTDTSFNDNYHNTVAHDEINDRHEGIIGRLAENLEMQPEKGNNRKMNGVLQKILKCVQDRQTFTQKPVCLPITSLAQMDAFEDIDEDNYSEVIKYFTYIGGFTLKEAISICFKEGIADLLVSSFTWWGREEGQRPLYNTRLITAIYEWHFPKPTRSEFQNYMKEALRTAKERYRNRIRGPRVRARRKQYWNDEREDN